MVTKKNWFKKYFRGYEKRLDFTRDINPVDIRASRWSAAAGYLFFFIPLIFHDDKKFARFHCNQSFLIFLMSTVLATLLSLIPFVGPILVALVEILCLTLAVRGVVLALRGKAVGIPLIGWITLVSYRFPD
ncbi:MAG: hypothetical protein GX294_01460 [Candidatus Cloacimonetes bacterium]|nr:hypothetical protein [Candidatus Cloacimonadota bacterium]